MWWTRYRFRLAEEDDNRELVRLHGGLELLCSLLNDYDNQENKELMAAVTGKYLSEALILASTNPQYDKRLFIELRAHENSKLRTFCVHKLFWMSKQKTKNKQFMYTICSELAIFMYWTCNSMNNLLSYCGLVNARINASEKDLPVQEQSGSALPTILRMLSDSKSWN